MSRRKNTNNITAAVAYLAVLAFALWRVLPWLGWGVQPEYAMSAYTLSGSPSTASSLFIMLSKLAGGIAGPGSFGFSINVAAAFAFALFCAAAYFAGAAAGRNRFAGICALLLVASAGAWSRLFDAAGPLPVAALLLMLVVLCVTLAYSGAGSTRAFVLAAFAVGAGASQHPYLVAVTLAFIVYTALRLKDSPRDTGEAATAAFAIIVAVSVPLIFMLLRTRVSAVWGASWPDSSMQALNIPTLADFGREFDVKVDPAALGAPLLSMIDRPWAPYFPAFAVALIGLALARDKRRSLSAPMLVLMILPLATYSLTPSRGVEFFIFLMTCGLAAAFAAAYGEADDAAPSARAVVAVALCAAAVFPFARGLAGASNAGKSAASEYSSYFLEGLKRDAIVFIEDSDEPHYALAARAGIDGMRPDATVLQADRFADQRYRSRLRRIPGLVTLTEKQYANTQLTTSEMTRKLDDNQEASDAVKDSRSRYNLMMLVQQVTVVENASRAPVYFDTVQRFLKSRSFNKMSFRPSGAAVMYRAGDLTECIEEQLWSAVASGAVKNLPAARKEREELVQKTAGFFSSLAMSCDASPTGYSRTCLVANAKLLRIGANNRSRAHVEEVLDKDFTPLPELTTYCFSRKYFPPPETVERPAREAAAMLRDRAAAARISSIYADMGEYSYLHVDPIRTDLDKLAEIKDAKEAEKQKLYLYSPPVNTARLFQTAAGIDPDNARAHLFLVLLYEAAALHTRASDEADKLLEILSRRERTGKMDEYYYFMLQDLYSRLGRPADAEKYSKLITGGKEDSLLP